MSEKAPKTKSSIQEVGETLSQRAYLGYGFEDRGYGRELRAPESNRHPQAQAEIEKVYGSADGRGKYNEAVTFDHVSNKDYIDRAYRGNTDTTPRDPESGMGYAYENSELLPALRAGDIEREFHEARLEAVKGQLADIAMGIKEGTRWQRFKRLFQSDDSKLSQIPLEREKEFSEGRLEALPTEEESKEMAAAYFKRNEEFIRNDANRENVRWEREHAEATQAGVETQEPTEK